MWQGGVGALSLALLAKTNTKDQYTWITFINHKTIIVIFLITTTITIILSTSLIFTAGAR